VSHTFTEPAVKRIPEDLLPLTPLSFHILLALAAGERHGYGLMKEIRERTGGRINPATGTVYLALQRLEEEELVGDGGLQAQPEGGVPRRSWAITPFGRTVAAAEAQRLVGLVELAFDNHLLNAANLAALNERTHGV
jgi:DNA-binding PadR family transcriptional regulator